MPAEERLQTVALVGGDHDEVRAHLVCSGVDFAPGDPAPEQGLEGHTRRHAGVDRRTMNIALRVAGNPAEGLQVGPARHRRRKARGARRRA